MTILLALVVEDETGRVTSAGPGVSDSAIVNTAQAIARKIDQLVDGKQAFNHQGYVFNVLVASRTLFLCVAREGAMKQRLLFQFLISLNDEYFDRGVADLESTAKFQKYIEHEVERYSNRPEEVDKLTEVQSKIDEVKDLALKDIHKLLERQDRIEVTLNATDKLQKEASDFKILSRKQKCLECRRNIFWTIVLIICCLILLVLIIAIVLILVFTLKDK